MVKHTPLMYKKCENTFEILRSEITFLMDLYIWPKSMLSVTPGKNCCIIKSMSSIIEFISLNIQITK